MPSWSAKYTKLRESCEKATVFIEKSRKDKLMQNRESGNIRREHNRFSHVIARYVRITGL
jgi:hypothetical protein